MCLNFNPHCRYLAWTPTISTPSTPQRKKYIIGWWSLIPNFQTELSGNYQGLILLCSFYNFVVLLVVNNKCQKLLAHMLLMTENIFHLFQSGYCTSVPLIAVEPCLVLWNGMEYSGQWSKVSLVVLCKQGSHFSNNISLNNSSSANNILIIFLNTSNAVYCCPINWMGNCTMAGWMFTCSRLDAICIIELALSVGLVGIFVMWK